MNLLARYISKYFSKATEDIHHFKSVTLFRMLY